MLGTIFKKAYEKVTDLYYSLFFTQEELQLQFLVEVKNHDLESEFDILRSISNLTDVHLTAAIKENQCKLAFKILESGVTFTSGQLDESIFTNKESLLFGLVKTGFILKSQFPNTAIFKNSDALITDLIESNVKFTSKDLDEALRYGSESVIFKIHETGVKFTSQQLYRIITRCKKDKYIVDILPKLVKAGADFTPEHINTALVNSLDDVILKLIEAGVKFNSDNTVEAIVADKFDITLKILEIGTEPSDFAFNVLYKDYKNELIKVYTKKTPILMNSLLKKSINYPDLKTYKQLSQYDCISESKVKFEVKGECGYSSPTEGRKNETLILIYGPDHNDAFILDRELPNKFVKQGYDVIVSSVHIHKGLNNIENFVQSTNTKISKIFLFAHGSEFYNLHFTSGYNTVELISNLRESLPANAFHFKGVDLAIESCHSGSLDFLKLKNLFPEISKLYLSDISNSVVFSADYSMCNEFTPVSEKSPVENYVYCQRYFGLTHIYNKSFVDLNSEDVKEFIERNANKQLSQQEKTCFHRIHSEAPFKYPDELVNECKNYFETLEA